MYLCSNFTKTALLMQECKIKLANIWQLSYFSQTDSLKEYLIVNFLAICCVMYRNWMTDGLNILYSRFWSSFDGLSWVFREFCMINFVKCVNKLIWNFLKHYSAEVQQGFSKKFKFENSVTKVTLFLINFFDNETFILSTMKLSSKFLQFSKMNLLSDKSTDIRLINLELFHLNFQ